MLLSRYNFTFNIVNQTIFAYSSSASSKSSLSQILKVVGLLGGKFVFFSPSRFEIQAILIRKTSKIKFYVMRALKRYLNKKNQMHGRETGTIHKFSTFIFET